MTSETSPSLEDRHWIDHVQVLRRRWRIVVAISLGFVAAASFFTWRLPPVYQATARLVVGMAPGNAVLFDRGALESYLLERQSFETQLEVLRSEPVALLAAETLGWISPEDDAEVRTNAAARVKGALAVDHLRETRIVLVRGTAGSPDEARDLANAVAEAYIAHNREQAGAARRRSVAWLTSEIDALRKRLRASEEQLLDYLSQENIEFVDEAESSPLASPASDEALRAQIAAAEVEIAQLLRRYRERHPKVVDARARLATLGRRLDAEQAVRSQEHRKLIQYRILKRDAALDHQMYEVLLKKLKEADLADVGEADIRVLERAKRPGAPIAPRSSRHLALAGLLGLCLALASAYLVDSLDRSVTNADDVARALGLPTLGSVALFEQRGGRGPLVASRPGSLDAEIFRSLRTNVRFSDVDRPRRVVLVTSTGPQEGKSTILANLGVSLSQAGRRVLLVDTDLRRPSLHRLFALPKQTGLADVLAGDADLERAVRPTAVDGLRLLPCGTLPPNPAELIESARLQQLVTELRQTYDFVLMDSPPAGGLVDASLLSSLADGVLFVVEPRRFDSRLLRAAVRQLERAGARLYGVVLNKSPRDERTALYRYYDYGLEGADRADREPVAATGAEGA